MFVACLIGTDYEEEDWPAVWQVEVRIASALFGYGAELQIIGTREALLAELRKLVFSELPENLHSLCEQILHIEEESISRFLSDRKTQGEEAVYKQLAVDRERLTNCLNSSPSFKRFLKHHASDNSSTPMNQ